MQTFIVCTQANFEIFLFSWKTAEGKGHEREIIRFAKFDKFAFNYDRWKTGIDATPAHPDDFLSSDISGNDFYSLWRLVVDRRMALCYLVLRLVFIEPHLLIS